MWTQVFSGRRAALAVGLALAAAAGGYWLTRPRIAFLGFPSMYRLLIAEAASRSGVRYDYRLPEEIDDPALGEPDFSRYAAIYVSGRRSDPLNRPLRRALARAAEGGSRVVVLPAHDTARLAVGNADFNGEEKWIDDYWRFGGVENMTRLLWTTAARQLDRDCPQLPPQPTPDDGFYHPESAALFPSVAEYERWYAASQRAKPGAPKVFIDFADGWRLGMNQATDAVIRAFEEGGFNAAAVFGTAQTAPFAIDYGPDIVVSRKHGRWWLGDQGVQALDERLDVPLLRGLSLLFTGETFEAYRQTRAGIRGAGLIMGAMVPELDGAIEPTLIEGLEAAWYGRRFEAFRQERIGRMVERARRWVRLKKAPNREKKIAIFYVSGIGKGRITAAGLNAPRSLARFLAAMRGAGYRLDNAPADERALLAEMLEKGRNVSFGRERDLQRLASREGVLLLPVRGYRAWFETLPQAMRLEVEASFGPPPGDLMTVERDGETFFVVPKLDYGNVLVLPQPVRGARMDAKLQHNDRVPPPHQYLAVYWWLREVWQADALLNYGTHGTHEFLPGRPLGQLADDWSDRVLGPLPNLYVYVMDNVGEALIAKRRGSAVTVSHQIPPLAAAEIRGEDAELAELYRATGRFLSQDEGALKETLRGRIAAAAHAQGLDQDLGADWSQAPPSDERIAELRLHVHLIDEDKIPVGLHVHGEPNTPAELAPMIAAMLGGKAERGAAAQERAAEIRASFQRTEEEIARTLEALAGGYVSPGGGGDPLRNPRALPTGRNLYGINPAETPTRAAWEIGVALARAQLAAEQERLGRWPRKIGFTLWNTELIRQYGTDLAHIFYLLGVRPVWDHRSVVEDVELIPAAQLGRPRIDVVIQAASLFRDTFPDRLELLDKAVRLAAAARDGENYVAEHTDESETALKQAGMSADDARVLAAARIFGNSAGGYGTGLVAGIERSGEYADTGGLTAAYLARAGAVYTRGFEWGGAAPGAYAEQLRRADAVTLSRSTNVVGALTLDHYFEYLGGMTMAVRDVAGVSPETYLADVRDADLPRLETLREALTRDLRGKFWNPKWIRALREEGFSGAVEISQTATNLFGWQVTKPEAVDEYMWDTVFEIYHEDALGLGLPQWFDRENPFAYQNIAAVLLETARKGYWQPAAGVVERLAAAYADSVERHGAAGDIRTVGNRRFADFVERRLAQAGRVESIAALRREFERPAAESVAGRRLVAADPPPAPAPGLPETGVGALVLLALAGVFWAGWRRSR